MSWPSRKIGAEIFSDSPTTALTGYRPRSTTGLTSVMGMRSTIAPNLPAVEGGCTFAPAGLPQAHGRGCRESQRAVDEGRTGAVVSPPGRSLIVPYPPRDG